MGVVGRQFDKWISQYDGVQLDHYPNRRSRDKAYLAPVTNGEFQSAGREIRSWPNYRKTRLVAFNSIPRSIGVDSVFYKDEAERFGVGSFKAIGAAYAAQRQLAEVLAAKLGRQVTLSEVNSHIFSSELSQITLSCATDGNHGCALAWACRNFGCKCVVFVHKQVSKWRQNAIAGLGATVVIVDGDYDDSIADANDVSGRNGWFIVSDSSWNGYVDRPRDIMAGYGVLAQELLDDLDGTVTHIFLQCGVGSMAAAIAAYWRKNHTKSMPRLIAVEPLRAACLMASARAKCLKSIQVCEESVMAGLSCGTPSMLAWRILRNEIDDFLAIPDAIVAPTMKLLSHPADGELPILAGESAVPGLAALIAVMRRPSLASEMQLGSNSKVLTIGTEGVTDPEIYDRLVGQEEQSPRNP